MGVFHRRRQVLMKVAVLGSGNGAHAIAFEWAQAGHEVAMFDFEEFSGTIEEVAERGGSPPMVSLRVSRRSSTPDTTSRRRCRTPTWCLPWDLRTAPCRSPRSVRHMCAQGRSTWCAPVHAPARSCSNRGSIWDSTTTRCSSRKPPPCPYAVRLTGPAHITVYNRLKGGYYVAALPSRATQQVFDVVQPVHGEIEMADNVLQTTLQNGNPVIHPAVSLCNVALIERTGGDFLFYEEGSPTASAE